MELLKDYELSIAYHLGKANYVVDTLSCKWDMVVALYVNTRMEVNGRDDLHPPYDFGVILYTRGVISIFRSYSGIPEKHSIFKGYK